MGFDLGNVLFGGLTASRNPNDYKVTNPMGGQINGMLGQQAAQLDPSQQAQFRNMQLQQAQQLQGIASGQMKGAGELAADRSVQSALAAQQAQARAARGGQNAALAFRQAARNQAGIGLSGAGQAQQAALQDQQMAQQQLLGALGQGRSQDIGIAGQNAQLQQNQYGQNLNALTGLNAQDLQGQYNAMNAATSQQGILGGLLNAGGQVLGSYLGGRGGGGSGPSVAQQFSGVGGDMPYNSIGQAFQASGYSDQNLKTDISDGGSDIDEMLGKLAAKTYRYKDEAKHGEGKRVGIMAQDLQKSPMGAAVVVQAPDGLAIDHNKAISALLAATARLHQRMTNVEGKRG